MSGILTEKKVSSLQIWLILNLDSVPVILFLIIAPFIQLTSFDKTSLTNPFFRRSERVLHAPGYGEGRPAGHSGDIYQGEGETWTGEIILSDFISLPRDVIL